MEIINGATYGDDDLAEIINGKTVVRHSPFCSHQRVLGDLMSSIGQHIDKNKAGKMYSYLDVILEEGINRLQPDILFIKKENMGIFQDWIRGVPDMVCEIVSKGSHTKDTITKRVIYERYRVPEFWIVLPEFETIEILTITGDTYELFSTSENDGMVRSKVIEGLEIDVNDIFGDFDF